MTTRTQRRRCLLWLLVGGLVVGGGTVPAAEGTGAAALTLTPPPVFLAGTPRPVTLAATGLAAGAPYSLEATGAVAGEFRTEGILSPGQPTTVRVTLPRGGKYELILRAGDQETRQVVRAIPGWLSLIPPLLAIGLALAFRQVVIALIAGVWIGAYLLADFQPVSGFARLMDTYLRNAAADSSHMAIIIFSMLLGGMVGIISRSGGTHGIVDALKRFASNSRRGQITTWFMGLFIFFDDYANTLIVGNTMQPVTDRLKVSREKLAYIVDSTAAPVASVAFISTWIGFEVSLIGDALREIGVNRDPYQVFWASIPYRFYPILALFFGLLIASSRREFGPMLRAERRAAAGRVLREGAQPLASYSAEIINPEPGVPRRWINAAIPIGVVILVTLTGLWTTGAAELAAQGTTDAGLAQVVQNADSYRALLWASALGCLTAGLLAVGQKILKVSEVIEAWLGGLRAMVLAILILVLAWAIGDVCQDLGTSGYLVAQLSGHLSPYLLPFLTTVLAAAISFATGTSWGTMSILMPIVVPMSYQLAEVNGLTAGATEAILLGSVSSVLAGATFGDHCSPISDTTILSSMATGCDHIDHVRTQLPYALAVGIVGLLLGDLLSAWGMSPWLCLGLSMGVLAGLLFLLGKRTDDQPG